MMNFNFGEVANASQSTSKPVLEGNMIHTVKFLGCEARDIAGVKDPTKTYNVLDIKFANDNGYFTHTVWEPKPDDFQDRENNGIKNPSNVKAMMQLFVHLICAVNPKLGEQIKLKEKTLSAKDWNGLRQLMVKATDSGKDKEVQIKLIKNKKGESMFPYFSNYNRDGELYMSTNFIGEKLLWTTKEQQMITKAQSAPTTPTINDSLGGGSEDAVMPTSDLDFDF